MPRWRSRQTAQAAPDVAKPAPTSPLFSTQNTQEYSGTDGTFSLSLKLVSVEYILSTVDAVWLGVKIGVGIALGLGLTLLAWRYLRAYYELWRFMGSGCTHQSGGGRGVPRGWLTRDVNNNDWILWDEDSRVVLRCNDDDARGVPWHASNESLNEFLILAHKYKKFMNI